MSVQVIVFPYQSVCLVIVPEADAEICSDDDKREEENLPAVSTLSLLLLLLSERLSLHHGLSRIVSRTDGTAVDVVLNRRLRRQGVRVVDDEAGLRRHRGGGTGESNRDRHGRSSRGGHGGQERIGILGLSRNARRRKISRLVGGSGCGRKRLILGLCCVLSIVGSGSAATSLSRRKENGRWFSGLCEN